MNMAAGVSVTAADAEQSTVRLASALGANVRWVTRSTG